MAAPTLRRSFMLFHLVLGLGILAGSIDTLLFALGQSHYQRLHLGTLGTLEAAGAVLFLFPRTLRVGGTLMLLTILGAALVHMLRGQWRPDLLIYAAGTWFVMVHGAAWGARPQAPDVAA